ncbi:hypothetical protein JYU12_01075, partial [bacterium AH-315-K03]|nr:hypothetical protein [bacterium AH-315-K03]
SSLGGSVQNVNGDLDDRLTAKVSAGSLLSDNLGVNSPVGNSTELPNLSENKVLEDLLQQSRELAVLVQNQPTRTAELVVLYRQILAEQPGQTEATQALFVLKNNMLSVANIQIGIGELDVAQQRLINAVAWFPELKEDEVFLSLERSLRVTLQINALLLQAEDYLGRDRLIRPEDGNAKDAFTEILKLDPNSEKAQLGLQRIIERYFELAVEAEQNGEDERAQELITSGLSISPSYQPLMGLREQKISSLLLQAQVMESEQQVFGDGQSAAAYYQSVLAIDSEQIDAKQAIEQMLRVLFAQVEELIVNKNYDKAIVLLEDALLSLPNDESLRLRLQTLKSSRAMIDNLNLSGQPIGGLSASLLDKVSVNRTLYVPVMVMGGDA